MNGGLDLKPYQSQPAQRSEQERLVLGSNPGESISRLIVNCYRKHESHLFPVPPESAPDHRDPTDRSQEVTT